MLGQQVAHRHEAAPTRQGVVANVENAADPKLAPEEIHQRGTIFIGNPAPDAVQADVVEIREVITGRELFK